MSLPVIIRRVLSQFFIIQRDFRILGSFFCLSIFLKKIHCGL
jgi:hypothetical protein